MQDCNGHRRAKCIPEAERVRLQMKNPQKGLFWQAILILRHDMMHFAPLFVALGCRVKNMQLPIFIFSLLKKAS